MPLLIPHHGPLVHSLRLNPRWWIGYVTYVFPECAVRALTRYDLKSFQGRLLNVAAARVRPEKEVAPNDSKGEGKGGLQSNCKERADMDP